MRAATDERHGRLRISAPVLSSELAMGMICSGYLRQSPEVRIKVIADDRIALPVEGGFDIIIGAEADPSTELRGVLRGLLAEFGVEMARGLRHALELAGRSRPETQPRCHRSPRVW